MFDPGGSTGRLRVYPFLGLGARCFVGRFSLGRWVRLQRLFSQMVDSESLSCRRGTGESFTPYMEGSIGVSLPPGWSENAVPSAMARGYLSHEGERVSGNGMERGAEWQKTLRSAWWRARSGAERIHRFLEHRRPRVDPSFNTIYYKCGIMLIRKEWV